MSTPFQLPPDLAAQQSQIDLRRGMVNALMQSGLTPKQGQMVGGRFIGPSKFSGLLDIAKVLGGQYMNKGLDQQQQAIGEQYNTRMAEGLEKFLRTRNGVPGETMTDQQAADLMGNDQAPTLREPVQADPKRAMLEAMTSGIGPLQQIGQMELQALLRKKEFDPAMIKEAGGQFYDFSSGKPVLVGGNEYGSTERIDGDLYQRGPGGKLLKLDNAPKVTTNVQNLPPAAGLKKYQEALGESLAPGGKSRLGAEQAQEGLTASVEALQSLNDGARMGIAQPAMQVVRKFGQELGIQNAATAPTDALSAALKQSVFKDLGGLGAQISDADRKFVTEFSGDLATDQAALKRMLAIRIASQIKKVSQHNKQAQAFGASVGDPGFEAVAGSPLNIQIPDDEVANMVDNVLSGRPSTNGMQPAARPDAPIPLNEYLRQKRQGGR